MDDNLPPLPEPCCMSQIASRSDLEYTADQMRAYARAALAAQAAQPPAQPVAAAKPYAWLLCNRIYYAEAEAEFDWRNDPQFSNTGYAPIPVYTTPQPQGEDARDAVLQELAMIIRMLTSALKKHWPYAPQQGDLPHRAVDLLRRHGLLGSPLRDTDDDRTVSAAAIDAARNTLESTNER